MVIKADVLSLDNALRATYNACVEIDDKLADLKKMAGINTIITGTGAAVNTGATVVGIVKASKDKQIEEFEQLIKELSEIEDNKEFPTEDQIAQYAREFNESFELSKSQKTLTEQLNRLNKQSKKLGHWRTGLLVGGTTTNIAGAIISGNNKININLQKQIDNCKLAVKNLRDSIIQTRLNGEDVSEATIIAETCKEYDYVDISPINNYASGSMISSIVGATTGFVGTITSVMANTDKTRNDNTDAGKQKEKNLNKTSNVLAGASTVMSSTATVFNSIQISSIKKIANVAEKCTKLLKEY